MIRFLLTAVLLSIALHAGASDRALTAAEIEEVCANLESELSDLRSLRAPFVQTKRLAIFDDEVTSKGEYVYLAPDFVRLEMTDPFRSVLIAKKGQVAKYELIGEEWRKLNIATADLVLRITDQIADWMRGRLCAQRDAYELSVVRGEQTTITLKPHSDEFKRMISSIELVLDESESRLKSVTINEPSGDFTTLTFGRMEMNAPITEELFSTTGDAPTPLPDDRPKDSQ